MRRMILTSLVLLPVIAQAQARTSIEPKPSPSSAILLAELLPPAAPAVYAMPAPASAASLGSVNAANHAVLHEVVQTRMTDSFVDAALRQGGTLQYDLLGSIPAAATTPRVLRAVEMDLSPQEMAAEPAVTKVVIHATIDEYGFPRNLSVAHSAGELVDKKAMAAVLQYRFTPAMSGNRAVEAPVMISIKIEKP